MKLSDFGIAKAADSLSRTPTSTLKGKPAYLAPECVQPNQAADTRVDLFAAGLIFYQLLTLVHPFRRDNDLSTFEALLHHEPPAPSSLIGGLSPAIDALLARPGERPESPLPDRKPPRARSSASSPAWAP